MSKNIPFNFVLDYLLPISVTVKPMFGMFAVYRGDVIVLILRQRNDQQRNNGIWIATSKNYHESLQKDFPSLISVAVYPHHNSKDSEWRLLHESAKDFETSAIQLCNLIIHGDERIGRASKQKKKSNKSQNS